MKYIDSEKLITEINKLRSESCIGEVDDGYEFAKSEICDLIDSLQQEQPGTDMKSPFTGGKVVILSKEEEVTFRGEKIKITRKYYRCVDTGREFTDNKLDDDMMWTAFRAYCEKKGITSFTDIMLKQDQPNGYNRAMIEVKAKVDELYDKTSIGLSEYDAGFYNGIIETCMKLRGFIKARTSHEQPEVDLEKEIKNYLATKCADDDEPSVSEIARHFYELGLNARKED